MKNTKYLEFAATSAILNGLMAWLYAFSFIILSRSLPEVGNVLSPTFFLLGGLLSTAVMVGLFTQLERTNRGYALWALVIGVVAALGTLIHGGYDLANSLQTLDSTPAYLASVPNPVDPRGLLSFGIMGVAILAWSWLISQDKRFTKGLAFLGYGLGGLLVLLYCARLAILAASHPAVVIPAVLVGFVVFPAWQIWLGLTFWKLSQRAKA
ncbi:hypothetical protein HY441_01705 [Candidatus Microgenomates bacterium]|nr:hypothetical protein [Candidatus Microgenomates bacterium]